MEPEELRLPLNQESVVRPAEGNIAAGLMWGVLISIPLWISVFGWATGIFR
ncbi:hypothetical protein [Paenibacillus wynnii]|uniref:hypothetical protein n=1 Tax=Paenibacillus wynnii TaxID=268407 RepID=UPI00279000E0|nr:hypothetical protein [Paenibacillus wynnii]MDQ0195135.1 putative membrane protein [Paenibacillus wynnii]